MAIIIESEEVPSHWQEKVVDIKFNDLATIVQVANDDRRLNTEIPNSLVNSSMGEFKMDPSAQKLRTLNNSPDLTSDRGLRSQYAAPHTVRHGSPSAVTLFNGPGLRTTQESACMSQQTFNSPSEVFAVFEKSKNTTKMLEQLNTR